MPPITTVAMGLDMAVIIGLVSTPSINTTWKYIIVAICIAQYIAFFCRWCREQSSIGNFLSAFFLYGGNGMMIIATFSLGAWWLAIPMILSFLYKGFYDFITSH